MYIKEPEWRQKMKYGTQGHQLPCPSHGQSLSLLLATCSILGLGSCDGSKDKIRQRGGHHGHDNPWRVAMRPAY